MCVVAPIGETFYEDCLSELESRTRRKEGIKNCKEQKPAKKKDWIKIRKRLEGEKGRITEKIANVWRRKENKRIYGKAGK
jgi:hypothetical protein